VSTVTSSVLLLSSIFLLGSRTVPMSRLQQLQQPCCFIQITTAHATLAQDSELTNTNLPTISKDCLHLTDSHWQSSHTSLLHGAISRSFSVQCWRRLFLLNRGLTCYWLSLIRSQHELRRKHRSSLLYLLAITLLHREHCLSVVYKGHYLATPFIYCP
jgi:hypothetical protein